MYSGTTLTPFSGRILGAHQKLDRVARNNLKKLISNNGDFPTSRKILHFEGKKGPDAIKRKSPSVDEPWHYYSPFNEEDSQLLDLISDHYIKLVQELKSKNQERIAFEAAWLAHALTDGLTPAHHYPYEQNIEKIWGGNKESRTTLKSKWFPPADTVKERLDKTWKVWGPKGLISVHSLFELGIATIIAPLSMKESLPNQSELIDAQKIGLLEYFKNTAREIAILDMYDRFVKKGWSPKLVIDVRNKLGPAIAKTITISWYLAINESCKPKVRQVK